MSRERYNMMVEKKNKKDILFTSNVIFISVISTCLFGISQEVILIGLLIDFIFLNIVLKKNILDIAVIFLLVGMAIHCRIYEEAIDRLTGMMIPVLFYCIGKGMILLKGKITVRQKNRQMVLAMAAGLFINSLLNIVMYYKEYTGGPRRWKEFWTQMDIPATQHVFWQLLIAGLFFYALYYIGKYKIFNAILAAGSVYSVWFSLKSGSRLLVMVFLLVLLINCALYIYLNKEKCLTGKNIKIFLGVSAAILIVLLGVWFFNLGDCQSYLKNSFWSRDGGIFNNIRFHAQFSAIEQLFDYPLGGRKMSLPENMYFVHNVWLDMANVSGIYSFLCILVYTIYTLVDVVKLVLNKRIADETKYLLVSAYFSLWLYYMVETALDAHLMLWAVWMLVCGIIRGNVKRATRKRGVWKNRRQNLQERRG